MSLVSPQHNFPISDVLLAHIYLLGLTTFQEKYVNQMATSGKTLTQGSDGRADNPGPFAKYGSYGLLDLHLMLMVHIELVQVSVLNFPV